MLGLIERGVGAVEEGGEIFFHLRHRETNADSGPQLVVPNHEHEIGEHASYALGHKGSLFLIDIADDGAEFFAAEARYNVGWTEFAPKHVGES